MDSIRYSMAGPDDAANLAALSIEVWLHTYAKAGIRQAFSDYVLGEFTAEKFAAHLVNQNLQFVTCHSGPGLLGYLRLDLAAPCPTAPHLTTEIATLYVQAHHIRKGIGLGLLQQASGICRTRGIHGFWLSVNHQNHPAIRFYEAQQFVRNGSTWFELDGERHENFILYRDLLPDAPLQETTKVPRGEL